MKGELIAEIKRLLERADFGIDDDFRPIIKDALVALANYEEKLLENAVQELANESDAERKQVKKGTDWCIETRLLKLEDLPDYPYLKQIPAECGILFPASDEASTFIYAPHFLRSSYEDFCSVVDAHKIYEGYLRNDFNQKFHYRLQVNESFVEKERILNNLREIYKIDIPLIYSPYSRRAIDIDIVEGLVASEYEQADFCWKENGLMDCGVEMVSGRVLAWNIEIKDCAPSFEDTYTDTKNFVYRYDVQPNETSYVLPRTQLTNIAEVYKKENAVHLYTRRKMDDRQADKIVVYDLPTSEEGNVAFRSGFQHHFYNLVQLRTRGDVEAVLQEFTSPQWKCKFKECLPLGENQGNIPRYRKYHRYLTGSNELLQGSLRRSPKILVDFEGDALFLADFANYVLHYMEEHFPLYRWAGVRS